MSEGKIFGIGAIIVVLVVSFCMWVFPQYNVWQRELGGKAELKQADWNRQIAVREAEAKKEAAIAVVIIGSVLIRNFLIEVVTKPEEYIDKSTNIM